MYTTIIWHHAVPSWVGYHNFASIDR